MSRLASPARLLGVTALGAGLVAAAVLVPGAQSVRLDLSTASERAAATPTAPQPRPVAAAALTCPGPETAGASPATALLAVAAPPADLTRAAGGGAITAAALPTSGASSGAAGSTPLLAPGERYRTGSVSGSAAVLVSADDGLAPGLTAEQTTLVTTGDLRGLTSTPCLAPAVDTWLVGGGGGEGRRGRLVLVHPAATPVQVRVDVLSATGPVPPTPGSAVAVPARSRLVLLLDALAPGVASPVVHVHATGGSVAATLHDTLLTGTTPRGADDVAPTAAPARRVLVPGLTVNGRALLRLAAPGAAEAVGEVRLVGPEGVIDPPGGAAVRVPAGGTLDLDLGDLPPGTYGAEVTADVPVVAGAMVARGGDDGPADFAWLTSTTPLRSLTGLAAGRSAQRWSTTLELTAPREDAAVDLTTVDAAGTATTTTLRVRGGTSTLTALPDGQSAWLRPVSRSGEVVAARTTTYLNREGTDHGRLITAASLTDLVATWVDPVVLPAR
ncbi:MAG: hypothetical protein H7231_09995 [Rhodoferax sp.]|nr:hypothetical protein [Actinomycetota bacterium]